MPEIRNFRGLNFKAKMNLKGVFFWSDEKVVELGSGNVCLTLHIY